jgi:hypothetical protein
MAERLGVGIIGCGGIAGTHIEALAGLAGDCRVIAVASLAIGDFGPSPRLDERSSCPRPARSLPREVAAIHVAGHAVFAYLTKGNSRKWASNVTMPVSPSSLASMA